MYWPPGFWRRSVDGSVPAPRLRRIDEIRGVGAVVRESAVVGLAGVVGERVIDAIVKKVRALGGGSAERCQRQGMNACCFIRMVDWRTCSRICSARP